LEDLVVIFNRGMETLPNSNNRKSILEVVSGTQYGQPMPLTGASGPYTEVLLLLDMRDKLAQAVWL